MTSQALNRIRTLTIKFCAELLHTFLLELIGLPDTLFQVSLGTASGKTLALSQGLLGDVCQGTKEPFYILRYRKAT